MTLDLTKDGWLNTVYNLFFYVHFNQNACGMYSGLRQRRLSAVNTLSRGQQNIQVLSQTNHKRQTNTIKLARAAVLSWMDVYQLLWISGEIDCKQKHKSVQRRAIPTASENNGGHMGLPVNTQLFEKTFQTWPYSDQILTFVQRRCGRGAGLRK